MAAMTPGIDPYTPLILEWAGHGDPTPCGFCDSTTPPENVVRISDKLDLDVCPTCAEQHDPTMAKIAANLEATWQQLLAHDGRALHLHTAADALRGMATELDVLNTGDRHVHQQSDVTETGAHTVYTTRWREDGHDDG